VQSPLVPHAAQLVLAAWAGIAAALLGIGALVRRILGRPPRTADDWLAGFWLGFATSVIVLQAWQLAAPVDRSVLFLLGGLGVAGILREGVAPWRLLARGLWRHAPAVLLLAVGTVWLALEAQGGPRNGDSGLYHVPTMTWHLAHRLPPGLGNLAAPFAYNQSFFLWAALLDVGPLPGRASHVMNTLFVVALLARVLLALSRLVRSGDVAPADAFYALMLPAVVPLGLDINVTSPSPDIAVWTLGIVLAGELARFLTTGRRFADVAALAVLVAIAPPLKLSLGGLAAFTGLVGAVAWMRATPRDGGWLRAVAVVGMIVLLAPGVWMLRGVVLSGYPLYPSTLLGVPVDWAVPYETVVAEGKLIRYWNGVEDWYIAAWRDPQWFLHWLPVLDWDRADVLTPLGIAAVLLLVGLLSRVVWRRVPRALPAAVLVPTFGSIAYCIANAPRARYPASAYWVLAAQSVWVALPASCLTAGRPWLRRGLAVVTVALAATFLLRSEAPLVTELRDFEPHASGRVTPVTLATGLVVQEPQYMQCWDAPLPCTAFKNDHLRLRREGDLAAGFTVAPPR
jgi:hypothetical protein